MSCRRSKQTPEKGAPVARWIGGEPYPVKDLNNLLGIIQWEDENERLVATIQSQPLDLLNSPYERMYALLLAVQYDKKQTFFALLEKGVEVNIADADGLTPLMWVCRRDWQDAVDPLLDKGAQSNVIDSEKMSAMAYAARSGHVEIVKRLLLLLDDSPLDPDALGMVLLASSGRGWSDIVESLLRRGADVNAVDNEDGTTPLMTALWSIYFHSLPYTFVERIDLDEAQIIVDLLLVYDPSLSAWDRKRKSVLMYASEAGRQDIVEKALAQGANVADFDEKGITALLYAAEGGHAKIVGLLLDRGAKIEEADNSGNTALIHASQRGHVDVVKLLLERGAYKKHKNRSGWDAEHGAQYYRHEKVLELLRGK